MDSRVVDAASAFAGWPEGTPEEMRAKAAALEEHARVLRVRAGRVALLSSVRPVVRVARL